MSGGVGVVGGGLLGLGLALRLAEAGRRVTLLERAPHLGGLAAAWRVGDLRWDRHYHVVAPGDARTMALVDSMGLAAALRWRRTRTGVYAGGRLHPVSTGLDFARLPLLSVVDKARLAVTLIGGARLRDPGRLDTVPVEVWLRRWSGDHAFEAFWRPLLRSKLGEDYGQVSARFIQATIARLYGVRRGGDRREQFGYLCGGYGRLLEAVALRLGALGVRLRLGAAVRAVRAGPTVHLEGGEILSFEQVALTTPAPLSARLAELLPAATRRAWAAVEYRGVLCASVLLDGPLSEFYVTNLVDDDLPFTGVIEMSALVPTAELGGHHLVYLPRYVRQDDPLWGADEAAVRALFLDGLARMHPHFEAGRVRAFRLSRARHVFPVPRVDQPAGPPPMCLGPEGALVVNAAHIRAGTLNVDETLGLAERAARHLLER